MRASDAKLAAALREAGLPDMAARAEQGEWNDFFGKHGLPQLALIAELKEVDTSAARIVIDRVCNGDFDAGKEESDEWAASPEGQEAFGKLTEGKRR